MVICTPSDARPGELFEHSLRSDYCVGGTEVPSPCTVVRKRPLVRSLEHLAIDMAPFYVFFSEANLFSFLFSVFCFVPSFKEKNTDSYTPVLECRLYGS